MKKIIWLGLILVLLLGSGSISAQNTQATIQVLQDQLQILYLQSTLEALQQQQPSQGNNPYYAPTPTPYGNPPMWNWNQQNSPYYATPTPYGAAPQAYPSAITMQNWPAYARPLIPTGPAPVWNMPQSRYQTEVTVGEKGQYKTIGEAVQNLPSNAGNVKIWLLSDIEEPQAGVSVPIGKKITSLWILSDSDKTVRTVWPKDRSVWFFCNGIPLIIDRTVVFAPSTMIMGGVCTYAGHNVQSSSSTIIINGKAYWVYAGGQSDREGHSSTVSEGFVMINGEVDRVFAGGRSIYGETIVNHSTVIVNGTAKEVYCSGYTEYANTKATVGRADMRIYGWYNTFGLSRGQGEAVLLDSTGCF